MLGAGLILPSAITPAATAVVYADEKSEIKEIEKKNAERKKLKEDAQYRLGQLNVQADNIRDVIEYLDQQISDYQMEILNLTNERNAIQAEIAVTESNLQLAYIAEANQYEHMKERIAYAYENGDVQYLEALMAIDDFSNIINQSEYISQVSSYDQNQLNDLIAIKTTIKEQEDKLSEKLNAVNENKADTEAQEEALEITQEGKKEKLQEYNELIYSTNGEITTYQQLIDEGDYEIKRLEAEYQRKQEEAKKKKEEEARRKQQEEERKRQEAEKAKQAQQQASSSSSSSSSNDSSSTGSSSSSSSSTDSSSTGSSSSTSSSTDSSSTGSSSSSSGNTSGTYDEVNPTYSSTGWLWPCPASHKVASYFGNRTAPTAGASTNHKGIDIGCSTGSKIIATAAGRVMYTSYSRARGYYIEIDHGNGITSLYQHLSGYNGYGAGDYVEAGTVIAFSGSTGISVAPHLHFEIHVNGTPVNPLNYVK